MSAGGVGFAGGVAGYCSSGLDVAVLMGVTVGLREVMGWGFSSSPVARFTTWVDRLLLKGAVRLGWG